MFTNFIKVISVSLLICGSASAWGVHEIAKKNTQNVPTEKDKFIEGIANNTNIISDQVKELSRLWYTNKLDTKLYIETLEKVQKDLETKKISLNETSSLLYHKIVYILKTVKLDIEAANISLNSSDGQRKLIIF